MMNRPTLGLQSQRHYWVDERASAIGVKFQVAEIYGVTVKKKDRALEQFKLRSAVYAAKTDMHTHPILQGYRDLYAAIGVKDAVASPELLLRLIAKNGKLPTINTVVDAYNEKSIETLAVVSAHDLSKITGDVRIVTTTGDEIFHPLGSAEVENLPREEWAGIDDAHVLCRLNCRQSELSKITLETTGLLVYVQGNKITDDSYLRRCLVEICECIVEFNGGEYSLLNKRNG
jgi:DNA/RNA-binding domain of Phe-tRNA-synthetase-like protein